MNEVKLKNLLGFSDHRVDLVQSRDGARLKLGARKLELKFAGSQLFPLATICVLTFDTNDDRA